jgi:hypothetical protein
MGQNHSRHVDAGVRATKTGGRKGGKGLKGTGIRTIPLNREALGRFLHAKTVESYASTFEKAAHGVKHLGDCYTNLT